MPLYEFLNCDTGDIEEHQVRMSELDEFIKNNPKLTKVIATAPSIGDSVRLGIKKNDQGWKEVLHKVAEKTPGGKMLKDNIR
jgi:hypothetical protein